MKACNFLKEIRQGKIPDFHNMDPFNYEHKNIGWYLLADIISDYPKEKRLMRFIKNKNEEKNIEKLRKNSINSTKN